MGADVSDSKAWSGMVLRSSFADTDDLRLLLCLPPLVPPLLDTPAPAAAAVAADKQLSWLARAAAAAAAVETPLLAAVQLAPPGMLIGCWPAFAESS